jgi:hypothetical protein
MDPEPPEQCGVCQHSLTAFERAMHLWPEYHASMRSSIGLAADSNPWTDKVGVLRGLPTLRSKDAANIAYGEWCLLGSPPDQMPKFIDWSQDARRRVWGPIIPTLTNSSYIYSFDLNTTLTGMDHMHAQGFPEEMDYQGLSQDALRRMAADGMHLPSLATIHLAYYSNRYAPWWLQDSDQAAAAAR